MKGFGRFLFTLGLLVIIASLAFQLYVANMPKLQGVSSVLHLASSETITPAVVAKACNDITASTGLSLKALLSAAGLEKYTLWIQFYTVCSALLWGGAAVSVIGLILSFMGIRRSRK